MSHGSALAMEFDIRLSRQVRELEGGRMVFFAGLPGTGKSLLVHQLAHSAARAGRRIHLLQWDVARPLFEASPEGGRYPLADGVTHPMIRRAAGLWARDALARWDADHAGGVDFLIGETPLVGGRFIELARRSDDAAEALLAGPRVRFAVPVPSVDVRRFLEAERERRALSPRHPREREDAPPHVLRDLWRDLAEVASALGLAGPASPAAPMPYDPDAYRRVYEQVLRHRNADVLALDVVLPTERLSVYDFAMAPLDLVPSPSEADAFIRETECRHPDPVALEDEMTRWWMV